MVANVTYYIVYNPSFGHITHLDLFSADINVPPWLFATKKNAVAYIEDLPVHAHKGSVVVPVKIQLSLPSRENS